jgi:membrane protein implicated in regulation of membrane protease activity
MILALVLLLLVLFGVLPLPIGAGLALVCLVVGAVGTGLLQRKLTRLPIRTGWEAMVGEMGTAETELVPRGRIKVGNETWSARSVSGTIHVRQKVRIVSFDGLCAEVSGVD